MAVAKRLATLVVGVVLMALSGCGEGQTRSDSGSLGHQDPAIPVSLGAMPTKASLDAFLAGGPAVTASGARVTISPTGRFALPADQGLSMCGSSTDGAGSQPASTFTVDGRFSVKVEGVSDQLTRARIVAEVVELSPGDIRSIVEGDANSIKVFEDDLGYVALTKPHSDANSGSSWQVETAFGTPKAWTDSWDAWDFLCGVGKSMTFQRGLVHVRRGDARPDALFEPEAGMDIHPVVGVPAFGMWLQEVQGPVKATVTAINPDGSTFETSVGGLEID